MRFKEYMRDHFGSCRLLATGHDNHRDRDVKVFQIPGIFDLVGISDGTDAWIAPTNIENSPLIASARAVLEAISRGEQPEAPVIRARRKVVIDPDPEPQGRPRRQLQLELEEPPVRRRAHVPSDL